MQYSSTTSALNYLAPPYLEEVVKYLWDDAQSIFYYDKELVNEYLGPERPNDNGGERNLAQIIDIMEVKWTRMDRYWFQKHRHLDRRWRTRSKVAPQANQLTRASSIRTE